MHTPTPSPQARKPSSKGYFGLYWNIGTENGSNRDYRGLYWDNIGLYWENEKDNGNHHISSKPGGCSVGIDVGCHLLQQRYQRLREEPRCLGFRVQGLGFRVEGLGFRV